MASKRMRELADGRRWDEADARVALRAWRDSGLSGNKFAGTHGLNPQRLFWWRRRLEEAEDVVVDEPRLRLVPAEVVGVAKAAVVLHAPGGAAIEIDSDAVSPSWVAALARELAEE